MADNDCIIVHEQVVVPEPVVVGETAALPDGDMAFFRSILHDSVIDRLKVIYRFLSVELTADVLTDFY